METKTLNTKCERDNSQMYPISLPETNNEIIRLLKEEFDFKKFILISKKVFCKLIRKGYILFGCKQCNFKRLMLLEDIFINGYINGNICKTCEYDNCLWIDCDKGGYIKE